MKKNQTPSTNWEGASQPPFAAASTPTLAVLPPFFSLHPSIHPPCVFFFCIVFNPFHLRLSFSRFVQTRGCILWPLLKHTLLNRPIPASSLFSGEINHISPVRSFGCTTTIQLSRSFSLLHTSHTNCLVTIPGGYRPPITQLIRTSCLGCSSYSGPASPIYPCRISPVQLFPTNKS